MPEKARQEGRISRAHRWHGGIERPRHGNVRPDTHHQHAYQASSLGSRRRRCARGFEARRLSRLWRFPGCHSPNEVSTILGIVAGYATDPPAGSARGPPTCARYRLEVRLPWPATRSGETNARKEIGAHRWACMSRRAPSGAKSSSIARLVGKPVCRGLAARR